MEEFKMDNKNMNENQQQNNMGQTPIWQGTPVNPQPIFSGNGGYQPGQQPQYGYQPMMRQPGALSSGARVGYGFLSLAPGITCLVLQFIIALVAMILFMVVEMIQNPVDRSDMYAYAQWYNNIVADGSIWGVVGYHIFGTLVFGIWYYFSERKPRPTVFGAFKKLNWKNVLISVLCGVCLCFFANGTVCLESVLTPGIVEDYMELAEAAGLGTNAFVIFASIVLAPIGEEFVCRGLTLRFAKKAFGKFWIANVLQALIFGLIHMNWVQGIYAFVIGLVLGWLVERYDSIILAMILHCAVNLSSSTWVPYALAPVPANLISGLVLTIVPMLLVAGLLIWGGKKKQAA